MVDAVTLPSDPVDSWDKSHHWMPIQATYFYPQIQVEKSKFNSLQIFHHFSHQIGINNWKSG